MNLEELVPPLELCKLIPQGEFADSAFAYFYDANGQNITLDKREGDAIWKDCVIASAPTLQEILAELPGSSCYRAHDSWLADIAIKFDLPVQLDQNPTTAALRLWLEVKGIEK